MNTKCLEEKCIERFGERRGSKLYNAMLQLSKLDFCVATAWYAKQVSIARSCNMRGKIFYLTRSYKSLILPDKRKVPIIRVSRNDICTYLPSISSAGHFEHCQFYKSE